MADLQELLQSKLKSAAEDFMEGRLESAEKSFRSVLSYAPEDPQILGFLAAIAVRSGDDKKALDLLEFAVAKNPSNDEVRYNLGTHLLALKRFADARTTLETALSINPRHAAAAFNLGKALVGMDQPALAADAFTQAILHRPGDVKARSERAKCLIQCNALSEAQRFLHDDIRDFPDDPELRFSQGHLNLKNQDWDAAIRELDIVLAAIPWHAPAVAFKSIALHEAGRDAEAGALTGLDDLVQISDFTSGYSPQQRTELSEAIADHSSLVWERSGTSTSGGGQTGNLVDDPSTIIRNFTVALTDHVDAWVKDLVYSQNHPFTATIPKSWRYSIWATVLGSGGNQTPHLHPAGWLSGVYYVDIPESFSATASNDHDGWIEFGAPGYGYDPVRKPGIRLFQPVEDRLILFPSSVFHRTLPFTDTSNRTSIAFDLVPTDA